LDDDGAGAAGADRTIAGKLTSQLAAQAAIRDRDPGLSLARYLLEQWLPPSA
jgi:hypothetical protein